MEFGQKFGVGLLMFIPALIGGAIIHDHLHSWALVIIWLALMPVLFWAIITGKFNKAKQEG